VAWHPGWHESKKLFIKSGSSSIIKSVRSYIKRSYSIGHNGDTGRGAVELPVVFNLTFGHRNGAEFHLVLTQVKYATPNV